MFPGCDFVRGRGPQLILQTNSPPIDMWSTSHRQARFGAIFAMCERGPNRPEERLRATKEAIMDTVCTNSFGRRKSSNNGWIAAVAITCLSAGIQGAHAQHADTSPVREDPRAVHNMLVVGRDTIFLSHLPMFDGTNSTKTAFTSRHRYQVILQATFSQNGNDVGDLYAQDRQRQATVKMYTLSPEPFVLSRLFTPGQEPTLNGLTATVFRGHLERGGTPIDGLRDIRVHIDKVIYARQLDPTDSKPDKLTYVLFGKGQELFLAHQITEPPDFDQILSVKVDGDRFTDEELDHGVEVVIPDRDNFSPQRIKEKEAVSGRGHVTGAHQFLNLRIQANLEFYFEEGELFIPPTFDQTPEERKSGF
jgi:hypothetical protein